MPANQRRGHGAVRSVLIAYGTIAYAYLMAPTDGAEAQSPGGFASTRSLMLAGVVVQVGLMLIHALVRRYVSDQDAATQAAAVVELTGDAATVLLFALGTLGPIFAFQSSL
jgi:hypothetical protein